MVDTKRFYSVTTILIFNKILYIQWGFHHPDHIMTRFRDVESILAVVKEVSQILDESSSFPEIVEPKALLQSLVNTAESFSHLSPNQLKQAYYNCHKLCAYLNIPFKEPIILGEDPDDFELDVREFSHIFQISREYYRFVHLEFRFPTQVSRDLIPDIAQILKAFENQSVKMNLIPMHVASILPPLCIQIQVTRYQILEPWFSAQIVPLLLSNAKIRIEKCESIADLGNLSSLPETENKIETARDSAVSQTITVIPSSMSETKEIEEIPLATSETKEIKVPFALFFSIPLIYSAYTSPLATGKCLGNVR